MIFYFMWWIPFTIWNILHGRFINKSKEAGGQDTIYHYNMRRNKAVSKGCKFDKNNPYNIKSVLLY